MIWFWDACTTEPMTYLMRESLIAPPGWVERCYFDPETSKEICVSEAQYQAPGLVVEQWTPDKSGEDSGLLPEPGGIVLIDIQAVDEAGNVSMGECP